MRNARIFRRQRPTQSSISLTYRQSFSQHLCYAQQQHDPTKNPLDPGLPPGFQGVHLGQQSTGPFSLTIYVAGTKFREHYMCGIAWQGTMGDQNYLVQRGALCYSASTIKSEALACLRALDWAREIGHQRIKLCTSSTTLVQALRSKGPHEINICWTLEQIVTIAKDFLSCLVLHVPKTQVAETRRLAYWCERTSFSFKRPGLVSLSSVCLCFSVCYFDVKNKKN